MRSAECGVKKMANDERKENQLLLRTKQFSLRILRLCQKLPTGRIESMIANQLMRSGTSVGANYRAAMRARSPAEFRAKLGIVEEECDESLYWMELIIESEIFPKERLADLMSEANEILSMVIASINTSRKNSP
jgi:four helix bundle protein